jgi:Zn-dependent metalloprotease
LWVFRGQKRDRLVYRVQMRREDGSDETAMPIYFIDAHTGAKVWSYDNLQTQSATGSGVSLYSGTVSLNTYKSGTTFYLEDVGRKVGTFNFNNTTTTAARFTDADNLWDSTVQKAGVDAQFGAVKTYDYFKNVHGRNGIDGSGGPGSTTSIDGVTRLITSRVHYSTNYNNAFWNGTVMTYGDGNGTTFSPLVSLDVAGHEMTHGVTERTANLTYSGESGALNESMSDVFGAMVERSVQGETVNTWRIGEQIYTPATAGDALRYMDNPHLASNGGFTTDDDPDHYSERYTGTSDNGGVHINSGIANKAFYIVAKGGTHHLRPGVTLTGIGADDAAKIWYRALTSFMTSSTNFAGARTATLNAANALFGSTTSTQYKAVCEAWFTVGVGTSCAAPTPTPPPGGPNLLVNGGFETSIAPWVMSGTGALYTANGSSPQAGTGYAYFGAANSVTGQTYQQFAIPSTATSANLTFWLNVTSAETTTTTQYDQLFVEVRNSAGTLLATLATYSNLNKAAASTTYTQRGPFSLLAYKGQTVRVQFRTTTDSSASTTFRVDTAAVQ